MKKYAFAASVLITLATLFSCGASAYAQDGDQEVTIPGNPPPILGQYSGDQVPPEDSVSNDSLEDGLGDAADGIGSGDETTTQSVEEGLEDAVEDVEPDTGGDAVIGTGSYLEGLASSEEAAPVEAAEPSGTIVQENPSAAYTELPDTGGVSPVAMVLGVVLSCISAAIVLGFAARSRV